VTDRLPAPVGTSRQGKAPRALPSPRRGVVQPRQCASGGRPIRRGGALLRPRRGVRPWQPRPRGSTSGQALAQDERHERVARGAPGRHPAAGMTLDDGGRYVALVSGLRALSADGSTAAGTRRWRAFGAICRNAGRRASRSGACGAHSCHFRLESCQKLCSIPTAMIRGSAPEDADGRPGAAQVLATLGFVHSCAAEVSHPAQ